MKPCLQVLVGLSCLLAATAAEQNSAIYSSVRSVSGQFVVYGTFSGAAGIGTKKIPANTNLVRLEPAVLAVSCERIKQALLRELGATDQWRGKIHLVVHADQESEQEIIATASKFPDGWSYRMDLPEFLEPTGLIRAMVRILLLEWANRYATERSAEIPAWLSEGVSEKIIRSSTVELVVRPAAIGATGLLPTPSLREQRKIGSLSSAPGQLRARPVLTVEQLSWPTEEHLRESEPAEIYRHSAELFVSELLRLRTGRVCLQAMLKALPYSLNWQTAFFQAFGAYFQDPLDLEKWWALQVVNLTGQGPGTLGSQQDALKRLEALLRIPVRVSLNNNSLPQQTEVPLQTVIHEWDYPSQRQTLQNTVRHLHTLGLQAEQPVKALADEYRLTLQEYLEKMDKRGSARSVKRVPAVKKMIDEVVAKLNELDVKLAMLRPTTDTENQPDSPEAGNP